MGRGTCWLALAIGMIWMAPLSPPVAAARQGGVGAAQTPFDDVDPFIGTGGEGHTYPGATVPWGMVQLSPETDAPSFKGGFRWSAGYQYGDTSILGFAHTHFSGTGHSDLGDVLLMPTTGPLKLDPGPKNDPDAGYRSRFSHDQESAEPGYYSVVLQDYGITAELTATTRVGVHRYTFERGGPAHVILDLVSSIYNYDGKVLWSQLRVREQDDGDRVPRDAGLGAAPHGVFRHRVLHALHRLRHRQRGAGGLQGVRPAGAALRELSRRGRPEAEGVPRLRAAAGRHDRGEGGHLVGRHRRRAEEPPRRGPRLGLRRRPRGGEARVGRGALDNRRGRDAEGEAELLHRRVPHDARAGDLHGRGRALPGPRRRRPPRRRVHQLPHLLAVGHVPGGAPAADDHAARARRRDDPVDARPPAAERAPHPADLVVRLERDVVHDRLPRRGGHRRRVPEGHPQLRRGRGVRGHEGQRHLRAVRRPRRLHEVRLRAHRPGGGGRVEDARVRLRRLDDRRDGEGARPRGRLPGVHGARGELPAHLRPENRLHAREEDRRRVQRAVRPHLRAVRQRLHRGQRLADRGTCRRTCRA